MNTILRTEYFDEWLGNIKDETAKDRINARIKRTKGGNFGDCGSVGEGVSEMRIHFGPGYRLSYCQHGKQIYTVSHGCCK
jgi:putative addiction module killer protein